MKLRWSECTTHHEFDPRPRQYLLSFHPPLPLDFHFVQARRPPSAVKRSCPTHRPPSPQHSPLPPALSCAYAYQRTTSARPLRQPRPSGRQYPIPAVLAAHQLPSNAPIHLAPTHESVYLSPARSAHPERHPQTDEVAHNLGILYTG